MSMSIVALSFFERVVADLAEPETSREDPEHHLQAAEAWLVRAHDASPDGGVSYGYSLRGGWRPSYPETSGYIAPTFFRLAEHRSRPDIRERGLAIARWLLEMQNPDGSFSNPRFGKQGLVFDTGQDLFGLLGAFEQTGDPAFFAAAQRAGDWLVRVADGSLIWTRSEYRGVAHVYNTRTAWALAELHCLDPRAERERVARANLDFALAHQQDGYFSQCGFRRGEAPYTHTIAYAIRGLLESGRLLRDPRYLDAAERGARAMLRHLREDGFLPGQIDPRGSETTSHCCLTGNCQLGGIWTMLYEMTGDEAFRLGAIRALGYVMDHQDIQTPDLDVRGGIKGSHPIWGPYARLTYPSWAAKFFIDAMLSKTSWGLGLSRC
jgi:hypothetical protein